MKNPNLLHRSKTKFSSNMAKPKFYDILPNINIYKTDTKYKQTSLLEFENKVENEEYKYSISQQRWKFYNYALCAFMFIISLSSLMGTTNKCSKSIFSYSGDLDLEALFNNVSVDKNYYALYSLLMTITTFSFLYNDSKYFSITNKIYIRINYLIMSMLLHYCLSFSCDNYSNAISDYCNGKHLNYSINNETAVNETEIMDNQTSSNDFYFNSSGNTTDIIEDILTNCTITFHNPISIRSLFFYNFPAMFINYLFKLNFLESTGILGFRSLITLSFYNLNLNNCFIFKRIILNLFSFGFVKISIVFVLSSGLQYCITSSDVELWALYDSFKRSYNVIISEFEKNSMPIFILSKKSGTIFYKNNAATNFIKTNIGSINDKKDLKRTKTITKANLHKEQAIYFKDLFLNQEKLNDFLELANNSIRDNTSFKYQIYCKNKANKIDSLLKNTNNTGNSNSAVRNNYFNNTNTNNSSNFNKEIRSPNMNSLDPDASESSKNNSNLNILNSINNKKIEIKNTNQSFTNLAAEKDNYIWIEVFPYSTLFKNQEAYCFYFIIDKSVEEKQFFNYSLRNILDRITDIIEEVNIPTDLAADIQKQLEENQTEKKPINRRDCANGNINNSVVNSSSPTHAHEEGNRFNQRFNTANNQLTNSIKIGSRFNKLSLFSSLTNEIKKYLPKLNYSYNFYLMFTTKLSYFSMVSYELLDKNYNYNYCISKLTGYQQLNLVKEKSSADLEDHFNSIIKRTLSSGKDLAERIKLNEKNSSCDYVSDFNSNNNKTDYGFTKSFTNLNMKESSVNLKSSLKNKKSFANLETTLKFSNNALHSFSNNNINNVENDSNLYDKLTKMESVTVSVKPLFADILTSLLFYSKKKNFNLNLAVIGNIEKISINKELYQVVVFNFIYFILNNIEEPSSKKRCPENNLKVRVCQEKPNNKSNIISVGLKFNCNRNEFLKFSELKALIDCYDKCSIDQNNSNINSFLAIIFNDVQVEYIDKFKFFNIGFLISYHLVSLFSEKKVIFNVEGKNICMTSSFKVNTQSSIMNPVNNEVEIKFFLPYFTHNNEVPEVEINSMKHIDSYTNKLLKRVYDIEVVTSKTDKDKKSTEGLNNNQDQIFDELPDEYNEEEENYTVETDREKVYDHYKYILNRALLEKTALTNSNITIKSKINKSNITETIKYIKAIESKIKYVKRTYRNDYITTMNKSSFKLNLININEENLQNNISSNNCNFNLNNFSFRDKSRLGSSLETSKITENVSNNSNKEETPVEKKESFKLSPKLVLKKSLAQTDKNDTVNKTVAISSITKEIKEIDIKEKEDMNNQILDSQATDRSFKFYNPSNALALSERKNKIKWDLTKFKVRYFTPPRYLIVEDNYLGRRDLGRTIRIYNSNHYVDLAESGPEAIHKFTKMLTQGYIYDYIFMDIDLPDIRGNVVTKMIRDIEKRFGVHTNIAAVTVGNIDEFFGDNVFDKLFEKPINDAKNLYHEIDKHFSNNRPSLKQTQNQED